jgi:hypothetical protein
MAKDDIIATIKQRRAEWEGLLAEVGEARMTERGVAENWSVKDIVAHVAWYEWWSAELIRTKDWPKLPAHLDSEDTDTRNNAYYLEKRDAPLADVLDEARESYDGLIEAIDGLTEEEFNEPARLGMPEDPAWALSSWLPENTYLHYEQHAPEILAWLKTRD